MLAVQGKDNLPQSAGKRPSAFQKGYSDLAKQCRQRLDEGDDGSLDTDNLSGMLLLSIAATSATGDLVARQPVFAHQVLVVLCS